MHVQRHEVSVTTDASGDATAYTTRAVNGRILEVIYTKDDFANGVDFTITSRNTGQSIWAESDVNASKTVLPRQTTHTTAGVAATYDGAVAVLDHVHVSDEQIKIVVAQGGDTKSGTFTILVG